MIQPEDREPALKYQRMNATLSPPSSRLQPSLLERPAPLLGLSGLNDFPPEIHGFQAPAADIQVARMPPTAGLQDPLPMHMAVRREAKLDALHQNGVVHGHGRKEVISSRKRREFIPDEKKDSTYWDKRRKNNEAAKRSREKRRMNDMFLENRVMHLSGENMTLKAELRALQQRLSFDVREQRASTSLQSNLPGSLHSAAPVHPSPFVVQATPPQGLPAHHLNVCHQLGLGGGSQQQLYPQVDLPGALQMMHAQAENVNTQQVEDVPAKRPGEVIVKEEPHNLKYGYGDEDNFDSLWATSQKKMPSLIKIRSKPRNSVSDAESISSACDWKSDKGISDCNKDEQEEQETAMDLRKETVNRKTPSPKLPSPLPLVKTSPPPPNAQSPHSVFLSGVPVENHHLPLKLRRKPKASNYGENSSSCQSPSVSEEGKNGEMRSSELLPPNDELKDDDSCSGKVGEAKDYHPDFMDEPEDSEPDHQRSDIGFVPTPPPSSSDSGPPTPTRSASPEGEKPAVAMAPAMTNNNAVAAHHHHHHHNRGLRAEYQNNIAAPMQMFPINGETCLRDEGDKRRRMVLAAKTLAEMNPGYFKGHMQEQLIKEEAEALVPPKSRDEMSDDERYRDKRRRNNEAAKKCRDIRRALYEYRNARAAYLEYENVQLRTELQILSSEINDLKELISQKHKRRQQDLAATMRAQGRANSGTGVQFDKNPGNYM
ncbi:uncharacterized protein [Ptychodera flava]